MKKYILLSLTIVCLLAGCKKKKDETVSPGSIYGTVIDKSTQASISGAGVELMPKGLKTVTGSDGSFQFTQIDPGDYNLFVTKVGYQDLKSNTITVNPGETAKGDVQIEKLPASIQIMDNEGHIIPELDFGGDEGIVSKTFIIVNRGTITLNFRINQYADWIENIIPDHGTIPVNRDCPIILQIDRSKLTDGLNTTSIIITSEDGGVELPVKARKGVSGDYVELPAAGLMVLTEDLGCVNWTSAQTLCESSTVGNFNDWRLPTKEELATIYTNRDYIGGFTEEKYWSSSWINTPATQYYAIDFLNGNCDFYSKWEEFHVRAVRTSSEVLYCTILGTVIDYNTGDVLENALVTLSPSGMNSYTGSDGRFVFSNLDEPQYTITVQKSGYITNRKTVLTEAGETIDVSIALIKEN